MLLSSGSYRRRWQFILKTAHRRWRELILSIFAFWIFLRYTEKKHPFTERAHAITATSVELQTSYYSPKTDSPPVTQSESHGLLSFKQAREFCAVHTFEPYSARTSRRKVYDLFMMTDELDWLEIRLHTLSAYVDYFVILESAVTFTGQVKPLALKQNWARFANFHSQIIYHEVTDIPIGAKRTWDFEDHQRNAMYLQVIPGLRGAEAANIGDILMVSDVDEIPRPVTITVLRNCDIPKRLTLRSQFYYYSFQWRHRGEQWAHPQATIYAGPGRTILPADLRNGEGGNRILAWWDKADLWNAGWHCSTCFQNISEVLTKMGSFSHTSLNQEQFRDRTRLVDRVRKGIDLWDRDGEFYDRIDNNADIPEFLKIKQDRFKYLIDRDGWNAGFLDYGEQESTPERLQLA